MTSDEEITEMLYYLRQVFLKCGALHFLSAK